MTGEGNGETLEGAAVHKRPERERGKEAGVGDKNKVGRGSTE